MDEPSTPEPSAIERLGHWFIIARDASGKRVSCRCAICGHVCTIGAGALESGEVIFCSGCAQQPREATPAAKPAADSFAANVADLESWGARKRHRGAS